MSPWTASVLSLWAAYGSAVFAQFAHLRACDDGVGAATASWISRSLLAVALALFIMAKR